MKNRIILLFILANLTHVTYSQKAIEVIETVESIFEENGNALTTRIYRTEEKDILKKWKSIMKDHNGEVKTKGEELFASEVLIETISSNTIEVFMIVKEISETENEASFIFKNNGLYISSKSDISGFTAASSMVLEFATELSKKSTEDYFEKEEKILDKFVNDLEKLVREKKKAEKDIEDCKETIKDNEYKVVENKKTQESTVTLIEKQKKKVRDAKKAKEQFN